MESANFEFLRQSHPELADLGAFAEAYYQSDPASSRVKSRILAENIALQICRKMRLQVYNDNFITLIQELSDSNLVPKSVINTFHQLRVAGNTGAHSIKNESGHSLETVKNVFAISRWWMSLERPEMSLPDKFIIPSQISGQIDKAHYEGLAEKLKRINQELIDENSKLREQNRELTDKEKEGLKRQAEEAASALKFDEKTTRKRLIDTMLAFSGWNVGDSDQVGQEVLLAEEDFSGRADYVLYDDDGTALAVIEAKKTAIDPRAGKIQGKLYADALEKRDVNHCRPLIILSNGYETWLVDDKGGPETLLTKGYADRKIYGIPSRASLNYRVKFQRKNMLDPSLLSHRADIAGGIKREYQVEAIKAVAECFGEQRRRQALIVQATGTGKTRVAVALTELLMRANFVKRVLFLCDRKELRRQAKNAFSRFLPDRSIKTLSRHSDFDAQVLVATYPAMLRRFQEFDTGWFDLIIADESHRSIYNKYRDLFLYFDALHLGLTATPVQQVARNTYKMFGCEAKNPTYYYEYERAIAEGSLVDFRPIDVTTRFMRDGIHYSQLSEEEKRRLEEDDIDWETLDVDPSGLDSKIYNKDTNRKILENLMQNGLRDHTENGPGKSIIFARNHKHAMLLGELFQEMYPEYGSGYCEVIDNKISHAEQLIDDFKTPDKNPVIAISVDMLDTGIDVPEVLNLVFAKPVKSPVKFWQMIGRGTRLCPDLHGKGKDKEFFYLFDHWGNCEDFEMAREKEEAGRQTSTLERLFAARIRLAKTALNKYDQAAFDQAIKLTREMINSLPDDSLPVKEKYKYKLNALADNVLESFNPETVKMLNNDIQELMRYIPVIGPGSREANKFDLLITETQTAALEGSSQLEDLRMKLDNQLAGLATNLEAVRCHFLDIKELRSNLFWEQEPEKLVQALEEKRIILRGIMQYGQAAPAPPVETRIIDIPDSDVRSQERQPLRPDAEEMKLYKERIHAVLKPHFETDPVLQKLRRGEAISEADIDQLASLVLTQNADVNLEILREFYPVAENLIQELRAIVGLDGDAVRDRFASFYQKYPELRSMQVQFLNMLQKHMQKYGPVRMADLYKAPFTRLNSMGPDAIFTDSGQMDELSAIIKSFFGDTGQAARGTAQ